MSHKFNRESFNKKIEAKVELELPHDPPKNVPEIRERLYKVEQYLGLVQNTEE